MPAFGLATNSMGVSATIDTVSKSFTMSYLAARYSSGVSVTTAACASSTVLPSALADLAAMVATMPPAPGRFSITTVWPRRC